MNNAEFPLEELIPLMEEVFRSGGEFRLCPKGKSMLPFIRGGEDSVALVPAEKLRRRRVYLYRRRNGQYVLHRLVRFEKGEPVFCGDNQTCNERGIRREDVLAEACAVFRGEKRKDLSSFSARFLAFFYCFPPVRYLFLFFYHKFQKNK